MPSRDHLRVCGADYDPFAPRELDAGSPPRVRSRLDAEDLIEHAFRITSACAEQTA